MFLIKKIILIERYFARVLWPFFLITFFYYTKRKPTGWLVLKQQASEINISEGWHMEVAFVDVWVTRNSLGICVSCSQCFNRRKMWTICLSSLSLLVLNAGIVRSTQCMFKPDNVSALQQAFIAMCWNQIFFSKHLNQTAYVSKTGIAGTIIESSSVKALTHCTCFSHSFE